MIYLYNYGGQPWKAQYWTRQVMDRLYSATPDGYCGDEDNGQTSAWYVFSALGFYPVCPGSGEYALGSPLFEKAVLHLPGGDVHIEAPGNAEEKVYVEKLRLNGRVWQHNYIRHDDLLHGAKLRFTLSDKPSFLRGTRPEDRPYSLSR